MWIGPREHRPPRALRHVLCSKADNRLVKEKSHKGQRHKGCGLCDQEKRAGNGADRRRARDRRQLDVPVSDE